MYYDDLVARKKLHQLIKNSRSGIFFTILIVYVFFLIGPDCNFACTVWFLVTPIFLVSRLIINSWLKNKINTDCNTQKLQVIYDIGCFTTSLLFGYFALYIATEFSHDAKLASYILLISIIPGAIAVHGVRYESFLFYTLPLAISLVTACFLGKITHNTDTGIYYSFVFIIPLLGALILAHRYDRFFSKLCINEIQLEESNKKLEQLASIDPLTNLYNRRAYDDYLITEWDRNKRNGTAISLMIIDIDYFKEYNDHYGHSEGDNCLSRISNIIKASLKRPADKAFRYGGDEFIVILPETDCKGTLDVGERIRMLIEELNIPHQASKNSEFITVSIGVASINPNLHENAKVLFDYADNQLYKSKQSGKNTVSINQNNNTTQ